MDTLFLHIGDGKTGTSFLQSLFALHRSKLEEEGILFPVSGHDHLQAEKGHVTGGNRAVVDDENWTQNFVGSNFDKILISAEHLIHDAIREKDAELDKWERWGRELGAKRIAVLLFIRNPVDHAASGFQQRFKTGQIESASLSDFFLNYRRPFLLLELLNNLKSRSYFDVSIFNYSKRKSDIREIASDWLGVSADTFDRTPAAVVNRGLTFAELRLVGALARIESRYGLQLANAFSNTLPELKPFRAVPDRAVQERMLEALAPALADIERIVGAENALEPVIRDPDKNRTLLLGLDQWRVVRSFFRDDKKKFRAILKALRTQNQFALK